MPAADSATKSQEADAQDVSVPTDIDLVALPQLCFPGGLQVAYESCEDSFHFLVFTDVLGNRTHGVVVQYYKSVQVVHNDNCGTLLHGPRLYCPFGICLISKYSYYNALKDCLSCLMLQLRACRWMDWRGMVKEFAAKLALVPLPPPGHLHLGYDFLFMLLPSPDKEQPAVDLDLHLPFLCFKPRQLLQVITGILTEQRMVFFSSDWARLTLVAECFMLFIRPLVWQHPFVPVLSRQMLDFVMAPTSFLMGCHLHHFEEVASETDELILINMDNGTVSSSGSESVLIPDMPAVAEECFLRRMDALQVHYDLHVCHLGISADINELRAQRRQWQQSLNMEIQKITLELMVNIFREVHDHLNYEHRVFNSEEFLKSRNLMDQPFYEKVLETHIFHSFLKDRLNRKMDAFSRLELSTRSEAQRLKVGIESPRRLTMLEMARKNSTPENRLSKRLGVSMPNLGEEQAVGFPPRQTSLKKLPLETAKISPWPIKTFHLPEFPNPLDYHKVQSFYSELISLLDKAISLVSPDNSGLLARYYYLRGFLNSTAGKQLDALRDFQNLYRTDMDIFPNELVRALVDSLPKEERQLAEKRSEIKRLISRIKKDREMDQFRRDDTVKKFELPKKHMQQEDFVKRVQESGIVKDVETIHRLFEALTVGQQKQVDPELFRVFYTFWKETEAEAQDVHLPPGVIEHLDTSECVYKLSSSIKTSHGVGKIAMTQKRLFLLTEGRPGYVEITKFRDIEEVKVSSAPFLLLRIPTLKIKRSSRKEIFEANLKSECDLWNLMVKEMWAGRKMADGHKDPQYMQQALTNVLLMDAVVGCLQSQKAIFAATKLAYFDKVKLEVPMMVPKTTSETLKHKINPSLDLTSPQAVDVLLYTPGQLSFTDSDSSGNPKLWCALSDGKVVVFDAASWSIQHDSIQVGNCMLRLDQHQVWIGSQDSVIYIINTHSMSCNKQLTEHRSEVTDFAYSCSADGIVILWDVATLRVRKQYRLNCDRLLSIQLVGGTLWCCRSSPQVLLFFFFLNFILEHTFLKFLPELKIYNKAEFSPLLQTEQLWTGCTDAGGICVWHCSDLTNPSQKIQLQDCTGVNCMIRVKDQVWAGCRGGVGGKAKGKIYVVDSEKCTVEKELAGHTDMVQALCSAEDRYVLSGTASEDGKIAIWKVE
uniref:DENN domain-containing protein 3 n=1 Tax=Scleropages formosus TaxID=113540 RepID=A0A8C9W8E9_SCLFO